MAVGQLLGRPLGLVAAQGQLLRSQLLGIAVARRGEHPAFAQALQHRPRLAVELDAHHEAETAHLRDRFRVALLQLADDHLIYLLFVTPERDANDYSATLKSMVNSIEMLRPSLVTAGTASMSPAP